MLGTKRKLGYEKFTARFFGKPKAKKFSYSSEMNAIVLEQAMSDAATLRECTVSDAIEDAIINAYIPSDPIAAHYTTKVLFGKQFIGDGSISTKYGVREALGDIFYAESDWDGSRARHDNNRPLVELAKTTLAENHITIKSDYFRSEQTTDAHMNALLTEWGSVCWKLETEAEHLKNSLLYSFDAEQTAKYARAIEYSIKTDPSFKLANTFSVVLSNWDILGNWMHTFQFMALAMEASSNWEDGPAERQQFGNVCQEVMSGWSVIDKAREDAKEEERLDSILEEYGISNGDIVIAPHGWILANPEDAPNSSHAGVIEIKNGERYNAPHILFFTDIPVDGNFTREYEANVLAAATSAWPDLAKVMSDEVELEYDSDGGVLNMKEYAVAPHVGLFNIYDKDRYPFGKAPYGACIIRAKDDAEE